ncbi:unnamed protein product [Callosobruchus maculatus]|uniref:CHK kinase-like domain-containing protein n=1 Tax=Callosobruchus maculatus TaxID=64391 RepID=A0A653DPM4_CALMS|nr:unnamed protein product [Callosobruchus maculatus]
MSVVPRIEKLEDLVAEHIDGQKKIVSSKVTRLTQPGENYGSEMLKVDLVLKSEESGTEEQLNVVAKLIPEDEFFQKVFNVQYSFVGEAEFYNTIVPTLQQFQKQQGMQEMYDFFAKFYGARKNLNGSDTVDENAVLLLENVIASGYQTMDRHLGFDYVQACAVLRRLAQFHAVPLALKLKDRATFDEKILPLMECSRPERDFKPPEKEEKDDTFENIFKECEDCVRAIPMLDRPPFQIKRDNFSEPISTLVHKDMWINNIMLRTRDREVKIVDFQNYSYDTPATDLIFFLCGSVGLEVLEKHFDELLRYYHENFVDTLKKLNCDTTPFTYEYLMDEIGGCMDREFGHCVIFTTVIIFGEKNKKANFDEKPNISLAQKKRIWWMVKEFLKKGWLDRWI